MAHWNSMPVKDRVQRFPTTRWSIVAAAQGPQTPDTREALERLCATYWYPAYAFIRGLTGNADDAEDLTQGLFASLLSHASLDSVRPELGRFRWFLLAAARRHLAGERSREQAQKRGGAAIPLSLDFASGDDRYRTETSGGLDPEAQYERRWAAAAMDVAEERLRQEFAAAGKAVHFEAYRACLLDGETALSYAEIADALGMTEGAVKAAVHRARRRFGRLLRQEIAQTVSGAEQVEEEVRFLFRVLQG
jgi:RNA polymerase sigma factor (sigma-70 family)